ncbi:hypothetical protein Tco_0812616 [Tanacetum coccineum]
MKYGKGSFNLNGKAGYDKEGEVQEVQRLMGMDTAKKKTTASSTSSASGNEEALARFIVSEYASFNEPYSTTKKKTALTF